jgi:diguanylate cyclase (GGDEF)-like protein/PAS domain S-box-containing protein
MDRPLSHPPSMPRHLALWLVLGNLLIAVLLIAVTAKNLMSSREADEQAARETVERVSSQLSGEIASELREIDNALATVALRFQHARNAEERRQSVQDTLAEQRSLLKHVNALRVSDAYGAVALGLDPGEQAISVADRVYFQRAKGTDSMVMSEPLRSRVNSRWVLIVARRLQTPSGEFAGVVYASMTTDHFAQHFAKATMGEAGAISLRTDELRLVARYSASEPGATAGLGANNVSEALRASMARDRSQGWFVTLNPIDRVERVTAYRQVGHYPLRVLTGIATRDYLAAWRREMLLEVVVIALVILTIAGFSVHLFRQQRQAHLGRLDMARLAREQSLMLENDLIGMVRLRDRVAIWENGAMARIFGYRPDELRGMAIRQLYLDEASFQWAAQSGDTAQREGRQFRIQLQMRRKDGESIWIDLSGTSVSKDESVWMLVDIDALKRSEEHAHSLAFRDALTGLPNRRLFQEKLHDALAHSVRGNKAVAVCYLDLDGFKPVNDAFGHEAGDRVLQEVSRRLLGSLRANDVVARIGGDEFALVLSGVSSVEDVLPVLRRSLALIEQPIELDDERSVTVSASLGAVIGRGASSAEDLMRHADEAMYTAKRAGKGRIHMGPVARRSIGVAAAPAATSSTPSPSPLSLVV